MERVGPVGGPEVHADTQALPRSRGKELGEAHKDLHITSDEFDEVGAEIASALDHFNVPEREKEEVLAAIVARKDEVVSSP
jgi:hemoglobin